MRFTSVVIPYEGMAEADSRRYARDFDILLDPMTGKLLKITSRGEANEWPYLPAPTAEEAVKRLEGVMTLTGYPDEMPVPFMAVLASCPHSPHLAVELEAVYVNKTTRDHSDPRPRWFVTLRGVPPFPDIGQSDGSAPVEQSTSVCVIFDGTTGQLLGAHIPPSW